MNYEQSTSVTKMMETTHGPTYSESRAIEETTWQSVDEVHHWCLTHGSCHWTQMSSGYNDGGYR